MARWCQNPSCSLFVEAARATEGLEGFYLNRKGVSRIASSDARLCSECDRVLAIKALTNPCPECLLNPERLEGEGLKDQLDISPEQLFTYTLNGATTFGEEWSDYSVEVLGKKVGFFTNLVIPAELKKMEEFLPYTIDQIKAAPWLMLPFTCFRVPEDPDLIVKIYRLRARYKESPLFAEKRFTPYGALEPILRKTSETISQADYDRAQKALELLGVPIESLGQPLGRPPELEGETASQIALTYAWLWFCNQQRADDRKLPIPTMQDLADAYAVHRVTLSNYIRKRLKTTWREVKVQGIHIGQSLTSDQIPAFIKARF